MTEPTSLRSSSAPFLLTQALASAHPTLLRAVDALERTADEVHDSEPLRSVLLRTCQQLGRARDVSGLVEFWHTREPGSPNGDSRYRWEINHRRGALLPNYAGSPKQWRAWRPSEQERLTESPFDFETRLVLPIAGTENVHLLCEVSEGTSTAASLAGELLAEAAPVFRRDLARHVQMIEPWEDTFTLWCLCRRPRILHMFHPVAFALATTYAAGCTVGGRRSPRSGRPVLRSGAHPRVLRVESGRRRVLAHPWPGSALAHR